MDVLENLISERLTISLTSTNRSKGEEVTARLVENVIPIYIELYIIFIRR